MKWLVFLLVAANVLDYLTFLPMVVSHGLSAEANPVVVWLAQESGLIGITLAKLGVILFAVLTTLVLARYSRGQAKVLATLGIGIGTVGWASNVASI